MKEKKQEISLNKKKKFGTFEGVFLPSILTILGVVMYLRMGWILANIGLFGTFIIIILSSIITFLTGLSISATATNMKVEGGGAYFMISRSFGIEVGSAIGIPLFLAQALGIAFYISGFSESVHTLLPFLSIKIISVSTLILLTILSSYFINFAIKLQFIIFILILLSLISFFLGDPLTENLSLPEEINKTGFWKIFAIFFPAVTGIEAGISMSGDLEKPSKSLPIGTLSAIIIGFLVYIFIVLALFYMVQDKKLMFHNPMIIRDISIFKFTFYLGLWGATLSSAIGALLGAPKTLQALSQDGILPQFFSKTYGKNKEPFLGVLATFVLAFIGIYFGNLNIIAPILTMFFLTSYGSLNLISGFEGLIKNPTWRPTFKVHWALSFIGAFFCFAAMFLINSEASFLAIFSCIIIFFITKRQKLSVRWTDMRRSLLLFLSRLSIYNLNQLEEDIRSWRPNILVLCGTPKSRIYLINLADSISQGRGFLTIVTYIKKAAAATFEKLKDFEKSIYDFLNKNKTPALVKVKISDNFFDSTKNILEDYGIGSIKPNTLILGDCQNESSIKEFCDVIKTGYSLKKNILIVKDDKYINSKEKKDTKQIDVWWSRKSQNGPLMLALAYLIQSSQNYMRSNIVLKSIVYSKEEEQGVKNSLHQFLENSRIKANIEIHIASKGLSPFSLINTYSKYSDLVFIGMQSPTNDMNCDEYSSYYKNLYENLYNLPLTIFTLSGEDLPFKDIFK